MCNSHMSLPMVSTHKHMYILHVTPHFLSLGRPARGEPIRRCTATPPSKVAVGPACHQQTCHQPTYLPAVLYATVLAQGYRAILCPRPSYRISGLRWAHALPGVLAKVVKCVHTACSPWTNSSVEYPTDMAELVMERIDQRPVLAATVTSSRPWAGGGRVCSDAQSKEES